MESSSVFIRIDRLSAWGTPTRAGQSPRDTGISRWERFRGALSALEAEHSRRERGKKEGSPGHGWAAGTPGSGPSRGGRGGHPLQGPTAALEDACGDV